MIHRGGLLIWPDAWDREEDHPKPLPKQPARPVDKDGWQIATDRINDVLHTEREAA